MDVNGCIIATADEEKAMPEPTTSEPPAKRRRMEPVRFDKEKIPGSYDRKPVRVLFEVGDSVSVRFTTPPMDFTGQVTKLTMATLDRCVYTVKFDADDAVMTVDPMRHTVGKRHVNTNVQTQPKESPPEVKTTAAQRAKDADSAAMPAPAPRPKVKRKLAEMNGLVTEDKELEFRYI